MVVAIVTVLAALVLPALARSKVLAVRTACTGSVRQLNLAIQMYADDHDGMLSHFTNDMFYAYKDCLSPYLGLPSGVQSNLAVFACPADTTFRFKSQTRYSSYGFNGVDRGTNGFGMAGRKLATVQEPGRTVLIGEIAGAMAMSWHDSHPRGLQHNHALAAAGFVDGHASYVRIYWNGAIGKPGFPINYEPPAGYDYKWAGD